MELIQWPEFLIALKQCAAPMVVLGVTLGVILGIIIGALPGLGPVMAISLALPLTFSLTPQEGISLLLGIFCGSMFGGSLSSVLLGTPGTAAAVATMWDGYPMSRKGQAKKALRLALIASVGGGVFSAVAGLILSPSLQQVAKNMSPAQNGAVVLLGMTAVVSVASNNLNKGLMAGCLGVLFGAVGLDPESAAPRLTFGLAPLENGVQLVAMALGLFAITEILGRVGESADGTDRPIEDDPKEDGVATSPSDLTPLQECMRSKRTLIRSPLLGFMIGVIPGTGAAIAAFVSYDRAKRTSKRGSEFGKGCPEGILAAESANSAVTGGSLVPMLALGIPGSAAAAIMIGALNVHGLDPGPPLFRDNLDFVYAVFLLLIFANIIMLILVRLALPLFVKLVLIPEPIIRPILVVLILGGVYAFEGNMFHVVQLSVFSAFGLFLRANGVPLPPLVICYILTPLLDVYLRQAANQADGSLWKAATASWWTIGMMGVAVLIVASQLVGLGGRKTEEEG